MSADMLYHLLSLRNLVKVYHWQTMSFARHKASDDLTAKLDALIDQFAEVYIGKYGRPMFSGRNAQLRLLNVSDKQAGMVVDEYVKFLQTIKLSAKEDTELLNIRDEMLSVLQQTKYLFTLGK
jgi:hypothetical protein